MRDSVLLEIHALVLVFEEDEKKLWTHQWLLPAEQFYNGWSLNFHRVTRIVLTR